MKHILSVQDLSCVGRCSLTVALPVLSAMGCRCSVLPTAVLSTHTAFPQPRTLSLTGQMAAFARHWQCCGIRFDAVTTGYLSDPEQAGVLIDLVAGWRAQGALVVTDPAMADHGKLYSGLSRDHVDAMAQLCRHGDVLLPNVTEAALLSGIAYREDPSEAQLEAMGEALLDMGPRAVVITGVSGKDGTVGFYGKLRGEAGFSYRTECIRRSFHGTGDLFAAVFTGALSRDGDVRAAARLAADFVRTCVAGTAESTPHGVNFEEFLGLLTPGAGQ